MRGTWPMALCLCGVAALGAAEPVLLTNGDFAAGLAGWYVTQNEQSKATVVPAGIAGAKQALRLELAPKAGANPWDISANHRVEAPLQPGRLYRVTAWLRGPAEKRVNIVVQLSRDPWTNYFVQSVVLTPAWRQFTFEGSVPVALAAGEGSVNFQVAAVTGTLELTGVKLEDLGEAPAGYLPAEQRPANPLGLIPFVLPWDDASPGVTHVGSWLDKPAGQRGHVTVRDGRLYTGDRRFKVFGTNITSGDSFPEHAKAEKVAARLEKFGINCVRFHHMDSQWANPSIFAANRRDLAPASLEKLDYFIDQLRRRGIYTNLNLHVSHVYPDFPKWEGMPDFFKGVDVFYPPMVELQRNFARQLLTHVNPYTGHRYADDPAVAFVEINNENGLISQWNWGSLDAMPEVYTTELKRQWNDWLRGRYADEAALQKAWLGVNQPLGDELLSNRDFAGGVANWTLETQGTAKAVATPAKTPEGGPALWLEVQAIDDQLWHVQFHQAGLTVEANRIYTLSFRARADERRGISVDCRLAHAPWTTLWASRAELTPQWQTFRYTVVPSASDDNARVSLGELGAAVGGLEVADFSFRPGGGQELRPGEAYGRMDPVRKMDVSGVPPAMRADWMRFLHETEERYWVEMTRFLKEELGVKAPIFGSAVGFSPIAVQAKLDMVDAHAYWKHPHFPGIPWDGNNWTVDNVPMAGVDNGGNITSLANSRVIGQPYSVTEYNHPAPNTHNSEAFLLLAAYGAMQDWDGIYSFAYGTSEAGRINGYFSVDSHPTQMATMAAAAALFLRGDVRSPAAPIGPTITPETALRQLDKSGPWYGA
ncbi:MAG: carbohydrate binding domain-containing protein, partial [Armatimonadetes bacterium]|nr:carbohydrate binding domain-containing protein [Armatimonadota bacterium]